MSSTVFQRRHMEAVADLIAHRMSDLDDSGREYVADKMAELFQSHNPRFKPSVFYKAANVAARWDRQDQPCRGCGETFPYDADADYCPRCARANAGRLSSDYQSLEDDGYAAGVAAGSWRIDGNTREETARAILAMIEEGDPEWYDSIPSPLAGEWADDPQPRDIFERCGVENVEPDEESELLDYWRAGYQRGCEDEVVRSARALLGLFPSDLRR